MDIHNSAYAAFSPAKGYNRLLVIDDSPTTRTLLSKRLRQAGYTIFEASSGEAGLALLEQEEIDVVLLDVVMPGMSGLDVLQVIRSTRSVTDLPVIMVTARTESSAIVEALESGANDYVTKPAPLPVVLARLRTQIMLKHTVAALKQANQQLANISMQDSLTCIANRRAFDLTLQHEWRRALRESEQISLAMVDIDLFKQYNDTYGHEAGDNAIRSVARSLSDALERATDLVARYGGEEFAAILPCTTITGARLVAERMRINVLKQAIPYTASNVCNFLTISVGVATICPNMNTSPESLVRAADRALYQAKALGRNNICSYQL